MKEEILKFINKRPEVIGAYGYGSGVFEQLGYTAADKPQVDLIFVVSDLKNWHKSNMILNPGDYTLSGNIYFNLMSRNAIKGKTGIVYLCDIKENDRKYKYGVIEEDDLVNYLNTWESFYLPGRFQKENLTVVNSAKIAETNEINRQNALFTALLLLKSDKIKLIDVYTQICGLSYLGDTRMKFAENPRKVLNIVEKDYEVFKIMYGTQNKYFITDSSENVEIYLSKLLDDMDSLPASLFQYIKGTNDINTLREKIIEYFTKLNKTESLRQTGKGLFSNGLGRSSKYATQKVMKKINSLKYKA